MLAAACTTAPSLGLERRPNSTPRAMAAVAVAITSPSFTTLELKRGLR